jgi:RNA polymerase sigma-70 factor (ECF subfamily)
VTTNENGIPNGTGNGIDNSNDRRDWLAERFEAQRGHLRAVAWRMLGSGAEADDAVQEAWLRLNRADTSEIDNLGGWLTTVVSRVCLDMLRSRASRREDALDELPVAPVVSDASVADPEQQALLADSVGAALLVVLDTLAPAERLAFVLHDMFGVPFEEIAVILDRTPASARQLASRARRRVQGRDAETTPSSREGTGRRIVDAFLAASREGDFAGLLAVLAPDVVLRADPIAVLGATANAAKGAPKLAEELHGAAAVADVFAGRAQAARAALIDGLPGATWAPGGTPRVLFKFTVENDTITAVEIVADPERVAEHDVELLDSRSS